MPLRLAGSIMLYNKVCGGYIFVSVKQCSTAFYDCVLWSMEVFSFNGQKAKSAEVDLKIMSLFYKVCIQFKLSDEEMIVKIFTCF